MISAVSLLFRSTGSYEPDRRGRYLCTIRYNGFDPQALTSLTVNELLPILTKYGFDPQALTSLTAMAGEDIAAMYRFRSTGSYEPDQDQLDCAFSGPDVSIHRLLRA